MVRFSCAGRQECVVRAATGIGVVPFVWSSALNEAPRLYCREVRLTQSTLICALCGREISGEPLDFEGHHLCREHEEEIGRVPWSAIGFYTLGATADQRAEVLRTGGVKCILLTSEEPPGFIVYVRKNERENALSLMKRLHAEVVFCRGCGREYNKDLVFCPFCGEKYSQSD